MCATPTPCKKDSICYWRIFSPFCHLNVNLGWISSSGRGQQVFGRTWNLETINCKSLPQNFLGLHSLHVVMHINCPLIEDSTSRCRSRWPSRCDQVGGSDQYSGGGWMEVAPPQQHIRRQLPTVILFNRIKHNNHCVTESTDECCTGTCSSYFPDYKVSTF